MNDLGFCCVCKNKTTWLCANLSNALDVAVGVVKLSSHNYSNLHSLHIIGLDISLTDQMYSDMSHAV